MDLVHELGEYSPVDIKKLTESNPGMGDNILNSLVLYNKAVENLKMQNEDIAIIELKKAVALNPSFYEALNLLGLCYTKTKDYSKAEGVFRKVMDGEKNSIKAQKYLRRLEEVAPQQYNPQHEAQQPQQGKKSIQTVRSMVNAINKVNVDVIKYVLLLTLGFLAVIICVLLVVKGLQVLADKKVIDAYKRTDNTTTVNNTAADSYKADAEKLAKELEQVKSQLQAANAETEYYKNAAKLNEVERMNNERNYEAAADLLASMKSVQFKDPEKSKFDALYADIIPKAISAVYNDGTNFYYAKNYKDALTKLNKILAYGGEWRYMDWTLYEIGMCYKELGDVNNAAATFKKIISTFPPQNEYVQYAQSRLSQITNQQ